ncbi:MAG TPA: TonB C-terminal domain-containing protein, partial [Kofleriaceae bacterium]|nr:TonB C-terminal domain-containing protein [Kofleriaceae bacterium]
EPPLKEMVTIEASLARKSVKKKQPQKVLKEPEQPVKPEGVSRDETKKPPEKKPPEPKKPPPKPDKPVDIKKFHHASDENPQSGAAPATDIGQFNGSEKGFAPLNAGHPYWQNLNADFHRFWEIPQISKVKGAVVGCIHLEPGGKIASIKMEALSGDQILDDSVERALKKTQIERNDKPQPVPVEELAQIKRLVCFRFDPNQ